MRWSQVLYFFDSSHIILFFFRDGQEAAIQMGVSRIANGLLGILPELPPVDAYGISLISPDPALCCNHRIFLKLKHPDFKKTPALSGSC